MSKSTYTPNTGDDELNALLVRKEQLIERYERIRPLDVALRYDTTVRIMRAFFNWLFNLQLGAWLCFVVIASLGAKMPFAADIFIDVFCYATLGGLLLTWGIKKLGEFHVEHLRKREHQLRQEFIELLEQVKARANVVLFSRGHFSIREGWESEYPTA